MRAPAGQPPRVAPRRPWYDRQVASTQQRGSRERGGASGSDGGFPVGEALDEALADLERKIERVRTLYDQYFMGIEKIEPQVARKEVARTMLLYAQHHIRNTGQRFRFHSLQQKWNIYATLWNRTMREIEAGTYRRDVARVQRKLAREGIEVPEEVAIELKMRRRGSGSEPPATRPADSPPAPDSPPAVSAEPAAAEPAAAEPAQAAAQSPAAQSPAAEPPRQIQETPPAGMLRALHPTPPPRQGAPGASTPPGVTEEQMRALFRRYVQAKRLIGDPSADTVRYEALVATVSKQTPGIMQKYDCKQVEFTVVIKDDKVVLKAIPKKTGA